MKMLTLNTNLISDKWCVKVCVCRVRACKGRRNRRDRELGIGHRSSIYVHAYNFGDKNWEGIVLLEEQESKTYLFYDSLLWLYLV